MPVKKKTSFELFEESREFLDELSFKLACFVDHYKLAVDRLCDEVLKEKKVAQ